MWSDGGGWSDGGRMKEGGGGCGVMEEDGVMEGG